MGQSNPESEQGNKSHIDILELLSFCLLKWEAGQIFYQIWMNYLLLHLIIVGL